ncbi:hypothetical protein [Mycobacteroides abscessus]|uniref:hypothetical protein n=1 Tax=Mycobacteroides abscessus TaxID=36809 RepID=UPI0011C48AFD|nr:hypothetical protein [Mycobacteroides abscessus]
MKKGTAAIALAALVLVSCSSSPDSPASAEPCKESGPVSAQAVAGASDNIFVARIIAKDSQYEDNFGPNDVYKVQTLNTLSGGAKGEVHVSLPGVREADLTVCHYAVSDLDPNGVYLLATRYNSQRTVYAILAYPQAVAKIDDDDVKKIATPEEPESIKAMREAIKHPVAPRM